MEKMANSELKLGIIAGGQLGKMLIQEASKWDITSFVMDSDENCPSRSIASHFVKGNRFDFADVYNFGKLVDILTFEIETINVDALKKLKADGVQVVPDPEILELIQDKGLQKQFYATHGLPSAAFTLWNSAEEIRLAVEKGTVKIPFVQKARKGGYDGRGVAVVNSQGDLEKLLPGPSLIEEKIKIDKEIAVIVARNKSGECKSFPVVEMIFDPRANLVDKLVCPSSISPAQSAQAMKIAETLVELLQMEGILAVEFFLDAEGNILLNEVAPRPHNSGHHSIESIVTSQFEQHLRAVLDLPLGSTKLKLPAVMVNILGEVGHEGPVLYEGIKESLAIEGVKVHLYGKKYTKPFRKMGHATILASDLAVALQNASKVQQLIKVKSWKKS